MLTSHHSDKQATIPFGAWLPRLIMRLAANRALLDRDVFDSSHGLTFSTLPFRNEISKDPFGPAVELHLSGSLFAARSSCICLMVWSSISSLSEPYTLKTSLTSISPWSIIAQTPFRLLPEAL